MGRKKRNLSNSRRLLDIISIFLQYQAKGWPPPTIRDICHEVDISSTSVVAYYFNELVEINIFEKIQTPSSGHIKKTVLANRGWIDENLLPIESFENFILDNLRIEINYNHPEQWKLIYDE